MAKKTAEGVLRPTRAAVLLFSECPSGLIAGKVAVRIFHYRGNRIETDPNTNLARKPVTIDGPLIRVIHDSFEAVVGELASGVQMEPLGFEIVQKCPVRVLKEASTNAVIHRDYRLQADIYIRIFSDRTEVESPSLLVPQGRPFPAAPFYAKKPAAPVWGAAIQPVARRDSVSRRVPWNQTKPAPRSSNGMRRIPPCHIRL